MKAVYYLGPGNGSVCDIPYPTCGDDEVIVKVEACGICYHAEYGHETTGTGLAKYPVVPGHEFAGVVHEIGKNVTSIKVGDRVTCDNTVLCGKCFYCKEGLDNYCDNYGSLGHNINGGFAEYVLVQEGKCVIMKDTTSFNAASLTETVACCLNCIDRCNIQYGDIVVIFGAGPNGLILAQLAKASNASQVIVIAGAQNKLDICEKMGIKTLKMDRNDYSIHEGKLFEMYPHGVDIVIDATAATPVIAASFKLLKKGGKFMQYSYLNPGPHADFTINAALMESRELSYLTACCQTHNFRRALQAIEDGTIDADVLVTHEYSIDDYFEALRVNGTDRSAIKVIIHPQS